MVTLMSATGFFNLWLDGQVEETRKEVFLPLHWYLHLHCCGCEIPWDVQARPKPNPKPASGSKVLPSTDLWPDHHPPQQHQALAGVSLHGSEDVMCQIPQNCNATHVTLLTQPESVKVSEQTWLPIRNKKNNGKEEKRLQFDFTVCISNLFEFNNALQYAQTLEMYRLLGVDRVVIYNTSCGPELDRLLHSYSQEGFVEMVPWPINKHLNPSRGWLFSKYGGDMHYFGQLATLNECIYRSMDRSRYVLLHDIDEIIMPYQHDSLTPLMDMLQQQHPKAGVFLVENHIYPKKPFEESKRGPLPHWRGVPGFNILEHIYKWEPDRAAEYHPYKLIIQPRMVEQTSVHLVLKMFGEQFKIPPELCHIVHAPLSTPTVQPLEKIHVDTRLWDFKDELIPNVNNVLRRAGLLY
ncbi:glycosyltransferase family 92 protein F13G3.3-like isoform X1 [Toxotes jaculatrix]|uniref:glycosyltransferase family 92 protein F13G3.3-like isoform X1 n=1 Tax=Toxotes jaculatrix TaxID=941984 RepID=UPI001B3AD7CE|nr:glycosyltransferase family 92 protein F13G3.3-like isoform X1 [Toxotes jaculatrix]